MGLKEAFEPVEAVNRAIALQNTWGHLAPEPARKYAGTILFTHSEYGDITVIRTDFPDLPDSPWFFEDMQDFIGEKVCSRGEVHLPEGGIYQFTGTYAKFKNDSYRFSGKIREVTSIPRVRRGR